MDLALNLGPHAAFIWASYAVVTVVVGALIAWLTVDGREQERRLSELAARGVKRRGASHN